MSGAAAKGGDAICNVRLQLVELGHCGAEAPVHLGDARGGR